jgi:ATP-dependent exoDNAse (exonuclease V) beta subunit
MTETPSFSIYDASAGSGKTYTLVKEYLKIILTSPKIDAYKNILAITFTNKAVQEMKSRIVDSLSAFATHNPSTKTISLMQHLTTETKLSTAQIKTKSQQIIKYLIHNYAAFDISTIDKFTYKVIRTFAVDLDLPMTFEVSLDLDKLLTESIDEIVSKAGTDPILTKLLIDFTMEKTDDDKSWDVTKDIFATGKLLQDENNRNEIAFYKEKSIQEFLEIKQKFKIACDDLLTQSIEFSNQIMIFFEENNINISHINSYFVKHIVGLQSGIYKPENNSYYEIEAIKINKSCKNPDEIIAILPEVLHLLKKVYKCHNTLTFYKAFLKNITPLSLLNTIGTTLSKIQVEQNVLSISEFNAIIYNEIQNQPAPFIYERLGEKYRHFFIDEFQDTSEMQWKNLIPLINNSLAGMDELGQKGTLMLVGDPKQSIYRWRGGKAEQFIALSKNENPFSNKDKKTFHLDTNYRSFDEIINFNNDFFKTIANNFENQDYKDLYQNKSHQHQNSKKGGFVNIQFIEKNEISNITIDDETDEIDVKTNGEQFCIETLKTIYKVLDNGFDLSEIAILTRKRVHGVLIANFLTQNKIPILSAETLLIANSTEVQLILDALRYLKNNKNKDAKANLLYHLAQNSQSNIAIHDFMHFGMGLENENDFEKWLKNFDVSIHFQDIRKKALYESVEIIIDKLINKGSQNKEQAYLQYFLDVVLEREIKCQDSIADFLDFFEANAQKLAIPSPEGTNAIRILTIHKSKGLEFPVVIMPFADEDYNRNPKNSLWIPTDEKLFSLPKILINNSKAIERFGDEAKTIYQERQQEEMLDNINALYVALTRAEEQLHIISSFKIIKATGLPSRNKMSTFFTDFLINKGLFLETTLNYEFGNSNRISKKEIQIDSAKKIIPVEKVLHPSNIKITQKEAMMWGTLRKDAIEYGNVIHEILSTIETILDVETAIKKAIEKGVITALQKNVVQETINQILNHPELQPFFMENLKVLNEQTIILERGKTIKPDRIVMPNDKEVYLLDYKTGSPKPAYKLQLENYQEAIEKMGFKVTKKAIIYIGEKITVNKLEG